jgi:eukaryotic-like serine/threonine-protein kinase
MWGFTPMIGKILSHYKILEKLGEGGMGVVYKAEDTKLDRIVALKFLPRGLESHEPERARFLQEAKAAAALNHPNVCTIYDISMQEDEQFITMEYIDGKTMKQMVPISKIQDSIDYAIQIGEALQEAHSLGVVHRDIKTENIMINTRNQVKVMDFGLAKLKGSLKLTKTSSTVGTLAYMSPEQIRGTEVDGRSDIFSFGIVLYEMLTGELPFHGEYEAAIVYSIVNEEPLPVHKYRPEISSEVLHILSRSLEKDLEERYQTVHDMLIDLKRVKKESVHTPRPIPPDPGIEAQPVSGVKEKAGLLPGRGRKTGKKCLAVMVALLCFLIVMTVIFFFKPFSKKPLPPMKIVPFASSPGNKADPAFSPDGDQIAYSWNGGDQNENDIYVKLIGAGVPLKLTQNPGNDQCPAWSPDGRTIAFFKYSGKESGIYKIPALGGVEQRLLAIEPENMGTGMDWSPDGGFLVYSGSDTAKAQIGIFLLSLANMVKSQVTFPPNETYGDYGPKVSPDGKWIAFRRQFSWETYDIFVIPFFGGSEKRITTDKFNISDIAWSQNGEEIIFSSNRGGTYGLWRIPFKGGEPKSVVAAGVEDAQMMSVSQKGQRLAYIKFIGRVNIFKGNLPKMEGQIVNTSRLIPSNENNFIMHFSPNGQKIAFSSYASGNEEIWVCDSDGSNPMQLTNFNGPPTGSASWSPDNQYIAFDSRPQGHSDIFIINVEGGQLRCMTVGTSDETTPTWSRDGRWIYFNSNSSGRSGIWKLPVDGGDAIQVSKEAGFRNFESKDNKWLYYYDYGDIWKLSLENGQKQLVLKGMFNFFSWVVADDGIYYLERSSDGKENYIQFLSFTSNTIKKLATLKQEQIWMLDLSPNRDSFLVTESNGGEWNIYLVENFR